MERGHLLPPNCTAFVLCFPFSLLMDTVVEFHEVIIQELTCYRNCDIFSSTLMKGLPVVLAVGLMVTIVAMTREIEWSTALKELVFKEM